MFQPSQYFLPAGPPVSPGLVERAYGERLPVVFVLDELVRGAQTGHATGGLSADDRLAGRPFALDLDPGRQVAPQTQAW
jgi:hypothetical protein